MENQNQPKESLEAQLTDVAAAGVRIAKLAILKGAVRLAKGTVPDTNLSALVPEQRASEDNQTDLGEVVDAANVLLACQDAFDLATYSQLHSDETYIKLGDARLIKSEYVGIKSPSSRNLYLHRPTLRCETMSQFPFWLSEETVGTDVKSGLPTLYYRDIMIDSFGVLQTMERLSAEQSVYRTLEPHESAPYYQALSPIVLYSIIPITESSDK